MDEFLSYWMEASSLDFSTARGRAVDFDKQPSPFKEYPEAQSIPLPTPSTLDVGNPDLWSALHARRSTRKLSGPLNMDQLAALCWAAQGVTARQGPYLLRTAPSAGALYPFETYVAINSVRGLEPCLTHFQVPTFSLGVLDAGNKGNELKKACLGQKFVETAGAVFIWTAVWKRCAWKYGDRATRYIGLDIGHVCQNVCLAAEALGLKSCPVGAFLDKPANEVLDVDGEEEYVFYLLPVGAAPG